MKKRIAAAAIAVALMFSIVSDVKRAYAAAAAVEILAIGTLTVHLLAMMNGGYDNTAEAIGYMIENGVEGFEKAFIGTDECPSWLSTGWTHMFNTVSDFYASGDISFDDDGLKAHLDYKTYVDMCNQMMSYQDLNVSFGSSFEHAFFSYPFDEPLTAVSVPRLASFYTYSGNVGGQFVIPVYYSDSDIVFPNTHIGMRGDDFQKSCVLLLASNSTSGYVAKGGANGSSSSTVDTFFTDYKPIIRFPGNVLTLDYTTTGARSASVTPTTWYRFSNSLETLQSMPDVSGYHNGYIVVEGYTKGFNNFIADLSSYTAEFPEQLDDLSGVLPLDLTDNPSFIVDTSGEITDTGDAVTVTDVPGVEDATLNEYLNQVAADTDIDIPSIIIQKFPFCVPFDFIRFIGLLCADPKEPVFEIPISTGDRLPYDYSSLEDNETYRDYVFGDHLFEIDEKIVLDLSHIPLLQEISYTAFMLAFIVMLIILTPKLIQH